MVNPVGAVEMAALQPGGGAVELKGASHLQRLAGAAAGQQG